MMPEIVGKWFTRKSVENVTGTVVPPEKTAKAGTLETDEEGKPNYGVFATIQKKAT